MKPEQTEPEKFKQRKCIYQKTDQVYLKILEYLDNPSEEDRSESSQIKQQHETVKLLHEETSMLQQKHFKNPDNELNRTLHEKPLTSKSYLFYSILTSTKLKYFVSYMIRFHY